MISGEITIAQQKRRIAELERRNVGLVKECQAQQEQITELKNALTRQAKAAQQGMAAAKKHGSHMESEAKRLHAECNPEALEGEREANAKLTELVAELESQVEQHKAAEEVQMALRQKAEEREAAMAAHAKTISKAIGFNDNSVHHFDASVQCTSIGNMKRFAEMLNAIEREFFMVPGEPDEDYPDETPDDVCLVNRWGSSQDEYIEQFRLAIARRDLIKQAEALELVNCQSGPQEDTPQEDAFDAGWAAAFELIRQFASELRQRAKELTP